MSRLDVREAREKDLGEMLRVMENARRFMRANGNHEQWTGGYPSKEVLREDIRKGNSYVIGRDGKIVGTFCFIIGADPTYSEIAGKWVDDEKEYGTIHRIASDGSERGVADKALEFCRQKIDNIRIDTHEDNAPMLKWIESRGFKYCGIIRLADGSPRKAFQLLDKMDEKIVRI